MGVDGQAQPDLSVTPKKSQFRSSIVWKLTLFVGVLVALNCGVLIGVAYIATSGILRNQIHERLSTVAADRQQMLAYTLRQQEERATQFAHSREYINSSPNARRGRSVLDRFKVDTETILLNARNSTTGYLAIWIEDEAGKLISSSGPEDLVAEYSRLERSPAGPDGGLVVPPCRLGNTFGIVFSSVVPGQDGKSLGTVFLLSDFGAIAAFLTDPNGLDETGEVLVGVREGKNIRLVLPTRQVSPTTLVTASEFPMLDAAIEGRSARPGRSIIAARTYLWTTGRSVLAILAGD